MHTLVSELPPDAIPVTRWSDAHFDRLRLVADPEVDPLAMELFEREGPPGLIALTRTLEDWDAPIPAHLPDAMRAWFAEPVDYPDFVDPHRIRMAEELFVAYGPVTTVVLLMCAVPHFFTNPAGARSFYLARIFSPDSLRNRMLEVSRFVTSITQYGGLAQYWYSPRQCADGTRTTVCKGQGMLTVQKLRMIHAGVRILLRASRSPEKSWDTDRLGEPINQVDVTEAVLSFCFCTIDGLAKLGIVQTPDEQEATLCAWKTVGHLLGMPEELQPVDVAEGRALHKQLFERACCETMESKVLITEVMHIMRCMVPRPLRPLPPALMRYLMGARVADQLEVPENRIVLRSLIRTRRLWGERQVFARIARTISPWLVHWMAVNEAKRAHALLPDELAARFGSPRA
jgi:hypothetical protein